MLLGEHPVERRLGVERPVLVAAHAVVLAGEREGEAPLRQRAARPGVEVHRVLVETRLGVDRLDAPLAGQVALPVVASGPAQRAARVELPLPAQCHLLVRRHVHPVDELPRDDVEGVLAARGVVVPLLRALGVAVARVVGPQLEPEGGPVAEREVVHLRLGPAQGARVDEAARAEREPLARGVECGGVGGAQAALLRGAPVECGAQPVVGALLRDALALGDVVPLAVEVVERAELVVAAVVDGSSRVVEVGRPLRRGVDHVGAPFPRAEAAVGILAVELPREGALAAVAQHDVDGRAAHVVLRRGAVHHFGPFDPLDGGRAQQRLELVGAHRRGLAVENHRHAPGTGERQPPLLLRDARQPGDGLVGVVDRHAAGRRLEVVAKAPLLDPHYGALGADDHPLDGRLGGVEGDHAHVVGRPLEALHPVGEVLEEEAVGAHARGDAEAAPRVACCGSHVERVAVEHHHGNARHGLAGAVHHAPRHLPRSCGGGGCGGGGGGGGCGFGCSGCGGVGC